MRPVEESGEGGVHEGLDIPPSSVGGVQEMVEENGVTRNTVTVQGSVGGARIV